LIPIVAWPGKANPRFAVVHTRDVAELAILAATTDKAIGQVYNVAGPEVIVRMKEVTAAMARAQGGPKVIITVPFTLAYVGAVIIESVAKLARTKSTPFLNRNIMLQIGKEGFLDGTKARTELGWVPQISLEEGTRQYVEWRKHRNKNK
jgi:nucleoside-diphosphate-sugar epimerase